MSQQLQSSSSATQRESANDKQYSNNNSRFGNLKTLPTRRESFQTWKLQATAFFRACRLWDVVSQPVSYFYTNDSKRDTLSVSQPAAAQKSVNSATAIQIRLFKATVFSVHHGNLPDDKAAEFINNNGGFETAYLSSFCDTSLL